MALVSREHGQHSFGLWADAIFYGYPVYYRFCDETCGAHDIAERLVTVGFYYRYALR
jgi:hypothetical protein